MARVTARQAFTRAKTRRERGKVESTRALVEAKRRYVRQLAQVGIVVDGSSQMTEAQNQAPKERSRRSASTNQASHSKKITDYFSKTRSLDLFSPKVKQPLKTSSSFDPNGIECVTIYDSDNEPPDDNNNRGTATTSAPSIANANTSHAGSEASSIWDTSSDSGNSSHAAYDMRTSEEIKPKIARLDISNLGVSFDELQLKVKVDEDVEIVDMLPPIPLRKHEVFGVDEDEENE